MSFETYIPRQGRRDPDPMVSINAAGTLSINAAATDRWLAKTKAVQLLFDPNARKVAVKPVPADSEHSLKLRRPARAAGTQVSAQGFLDYYKIKMPKAQRFPVEWNEAAQALVFSLGK